MSARLAVLNVCLIALMTSCGANYYLKRAIAKDPSILKTEIVKVDTLILTKERTLIDTVELYRDTVIVQDGVKVKLDFVDRYVKIKADCPTDTIKFEKVIPVEQIVYKKENSYLKEFLLTLLALLVLALLYLRELIRGL